MPRTTSTTTRLEVPCFGVAEGLDDAGANERLGVGAVVTFTRSREPDTGTGGTTKREDVALLRAEDFFTARFALFLVADFLVVDFLVADFLAELFLAEDFFTARFAVFLVVFFAELFLAADFFTARFADFLGAAFFAALFFLTATFTPWIIHIAHYRRTLDRRSLAQRIEQFDCMRSEGAQSFPAMAQGIFLFR